MQVPIRGVSSSKLLLNSSAFIPSTCNQIAYYSNIHSSDGEQESQNTFEKPEMDIGALRRYLLLTSRNRGRVETELFLGGYALHNDRIWKMTIQELEAYNDLLDYTDNELYEYLIGQVEPPEELKRNEEFQRVYDYVHNRGQRHYSDPERKSFDQDYLNNDCSPPAK